MQPSARTEVSGTCAVLFVGHIRTTWCSTKYDSCHTVAHYQCGEREGIAWNLTRS